MFFASPDGAVTQTTDSIISPDPNDDALLEFAILQAEFHVRTFQTDDASLNALAHMRAEYVQQYIRLNYGAGSDFNMPNVPGLGAQGQQTRQALVDDFNNSNWRINDSAGQPGGPGNVVRSADGTITANISKEGFEGYYSLGDAGTNYYFLHELAHVSSAGQAAADYFGENYLNRENVANYDLYGPNAIEFKNNEVYANWVAKEYADDLGVPIIQNPGYGWLFY
jgi:hypothetical protein